MRVLGIDPGSETLGWGVVKSDGGRDYRLLQYGTICSSPREAFANRLLKISDGLDEIIERFQPEVLSIEDAFFAVNVKVAMKLGQVRGVVLLTGAKHKLEIHEYAPRLMKQTVVGYGNAEKGQVGEMVRILLKLPAVPEPHDAADALALAICHFHHAKMSQKILAAQAKIKTPR
ncbi:MAG TPA: crossover junction endodeoxyribonuclease RuvC [Pyrinomonadaceae bacterium]|nr:crossover junction endodeoxyribonuclease RuvC [Pyrinomonadaceae bacterium]